MNTPPRLAASPARLELHSTLVLLAFALACGGGSGGGSGPANPTAPPGPVCASLGGSWQYEWAMPPCGGGSAGAGTVTVAQSECTVTVAVPGLGTFEGMLLGNQPQGNFDLTFAAAAPGAGTGCSDFGEAGLQEPVSTTRLEFLFGEAATPGCCRHGSLTLER